MVDLAFIDVWHEHDDDDNRPGGKTGVLGIKIKDIKVIC